MSLEKDSTTEPPSNVIDLPIKDHYARAVEILAGAPPDEFQATVAHVLTGLCEKIGALQNLVFILCGAVQGPCMTSELRGELAAMLDIGK